MIYVSEQSFLTVEEKWKSLFIPFENHTKLIDDFILLPENCVTTSDWTKCEGTLLDPSETKEQNRIQRCEVAGTPTKC